MYLYFAVNQCLLAAGNNGCLVGAREQDLDLSQHHLDAQESNSTFLFLFSSLSLSLYLSLYLSVFLLSPSLPSKSFFAPFCSFCSLPEEASASVGNAKEQKQEQGR
jgi:hypothetical protein